MTAKCPHCRMPVPIRILRKDYEDGEEHEVWVFVRHDKEAYGRNRGCPGGGTFAPPRPEARADGC